MHTNNPLRGCMTEALRLTRKGRLTEATAHIQRTLGNGSATAEASEPEPGGETIDVESCIIGEGPDESPGPEAGHEAPRPGTGTGTYPGMAGWNVRGAGSGGFRGAGRSGGLFSAMPGTAPQTRPQAPGPGAAPAGGRFVEKSHSGPGGTRAYKLYIPSGYVGQAAPLVVMLHGCTQTPDDFATGTHMNTLAEEQTFLVAYPAQSANANFSKCWNWFEPADQERGRGEPSLIAGITREIVGEYSLDAGRVYVAGMSSGGAMAAIMGETYPELYAAVGVHSGLAPGAAHDLSSAFNAMRQGAPGDERRNAHPAPTIVFHGDRDTTVHPRNAEHLLAHWSAANGAGERIPESRGRKPGGHSYTQDTRRGVDGRTIFERWTVHGLGHAWSGGSSPGSYTDPHGPDASKELARFFEQHRR